MSGETDLDALFKGLELVMSPEVFVFATVPQGAVPAGLAPQMIFHEAEGTSLILTQAQAIAHNIAFEFPSRMITLNIHSSLEAVGFIARVSAVLTQAGMGVNPVAGFYHDHLFIAQDQAEEALGLLQELAR